MSIKKAFLQEILRNIRSLVKASFRARGMKRADPGPAVSDEQIWADLVNLLELSPATKSRYTQGVGRDSQYPVSALDGRVERYEPPLDVVFHFAAIRELDLDFRGREEVNRALAALLTRVRRLHDEGEIPALGPQEIELFRFQFHHTDFTRASGVSLSEHMVRAFVNWPHRELAGDIGPPAALTWRLPLLLEEWENAWVIVIHALDYDSIP